LTTRQDLQAALATANVRAFLHVIRTGESSQGDEAYTVMFGGEHFTSFADHPRKRHTRLVRGKSLTSTAAGAYQFLARTWDGLVKQYGFGDFSPASQDEAAVGLLFEDRCIADLHAGRVRIALKKCKATWASLPDATDGQPTMSLRRAYDVYLQFGGLIGRDDHVLLTNISARFDVAVSPDKPERTKAKRSKAKARRTLRGRAKTSKNGRKTG